MSTGHEKIEIRTDSESWTVWEAYSRMDALGRIGWHVNHVEPLKYTKWGPYPTREEAIQASGMPRPKTEVEELWEFVEKVFTTKMPLALATDVSKWVHELKAKYGK